MQEYVENYEKQLERLLLICNDGIEGYRKAAEEVHSAELKELFLKNSSEREQMAAELKKHIKELGGDADNKQGDSAGKLHRNWMAIKAAFTSKHKDDQAILESCRTGEEAALEAYDDVLQGSILSTNLKTFLMGQRTAISQAFYYIDKLYFDRFKTSPEV